ncbi:MAG: integrase, partial [Verrucomicrobiaceae bacterium]
QAAITDPAKFGVLLRQIDGRAGQLEVTYALRLMALCYPRPIECRSARWEHIDFKASVWHIPAEITKMRRPHDIPLSRQALALLRELHKISGQGQLLFPSYRIITPISENAMNQALRRMGVQNSEHCSHGFRASASTILNTMGFDERVIEVSLAHVDTNQVRRAYNRSQYWDQRVAMAQDWADICDRLKANARDNSDLV